jgi:hypothetical protein
MSGADERRKRIGKLLIALGTLCLAASIALLYAARMISRAPAP